jgi:LPXTG-motif cell wall-anchored protein
MTFTVARDLTQGPTPIRVGSQVRVEYRGESELQVVTVSPVPGTTPDAADPADDRDRDELEDDDNGRDDNGLEVEDDDGTSVARLQTTQPERTGAATARTIDPDDDGELPGTASPLPLLLIAGLSLLGGGVGLSARRRR